VDNANGRRLGHELPQALIKAAVEELWESPAVARQLDDILEALEVPLIDAEMRRTLQRQMHRRDKYFGGGGRGHVTLLVRTILESENNQDALIEPIVSAVSLCMEPEWTDFGSYILSG
jgi:hypothetical protein